MHKNPHNPRRYDDIIGLSRPVSQSHPPMPMSDRAAQFSPFAALTGYGDAIREEARLTDSQIELDENRKEELNQKLLLIQEQQEARQKAASLSASRISGRMSENPAAPISLSRDMSEGLICMRGCWLWKTGSGWQ